MCFLSGFVFILIISTSFIEERVRGALSFQKLIFLGWISKASGGRSTVACSGNLNEKTVTFLS